jgi:hypothetical protein
VATVSEMNPSTEQRERLFFLIMALAIALTVVAAFSLFLTAKLSSFGAPWWVHVHAVTFMGWIAIYVTQNALVFRNDIALHRRLGKIGAVYWMWMVLVGLILTPLTLAVGRSPPFFTPAYFLALDWTNIVVFGALAWAAIANRRRTDWHRRLILCATVCVMAPAWGRLVILSGIPLTTWNHIAMLMLYIVAAALFDLFNRGRVHPAYFWGAGALAGMAVTIEALARFGPLNTLADRIVG